MRESEHIFLDGTWCKPNGFAQILIIQFKDSIIKEKIFGSYIIMNNKKAVLYIEVLKTFKKIMTQNNKYELNIKTITSDAEKALIKGINIVFPNTKKYSEKYNNNPNNTDAINNNSNSKEGFWPI